MPKKIISKSPLELLYEKIDPKPQFPLQTYKTILSVGIKIGEYPIFWRDRKPSCQQFMRSLHANCEMCGKDSSGGSLDVHHLKWDRKHDCTYDNLFVICRSCHTKIHRRADGWFPSKPWAKEWGDVPQGLIDRNHLDKDGNAIAPQIVDNNKKSKTNESERKSKKTKSSRKAATVSAQE
jgi:hypothetical protein